jgi:hypothetical protein
MYAFIIYNDRKKKDIAGVWKNKVYKWNEHNENVKVYNDPWD